MWEIATAKRHRFVWSQGFQDGLVVSLNLDHKDLPDPSQMIPLWPNTDSDSVNYELTEDSWEDLRVESQGV